MNRRTLLKQTGMAAGMMMAGATLLDGMAAEGQATTTLAAYPSSTGSYPYTLPALPYSYDALDAYIDTETMHLHHDKHHASYVEKLNAALANEPALQKQPLTSLLRDPSALPEGLRASIVNQGGGHANHSFWWAQLGKSSDSGPKGELARDLDRQLGGYAKFQEQFTKAASGVFGSGWAWLTLDSEGKLHVDATPNQNSPLSVQRIPVLGIDVWEHAYYLKYRNRRPEYIANFYKVVNWDYVNSQYASAKSKTA